MKKENKFEEMVKALESLTETLVKIKEAAINAKLNEEEEEDEPDMQELFEGYQEYITREEAVKNHFPELYDRIQQVRECLENTMEELYEACEEEEEEEE